MSLTRAQAAAIVVAENAELFTLLGVATSDSSGGMKEVLDAALRTLGVAESALAAATVSDDDKARFLSLLTFRALVRLKRAAAARAKDTIGGNGVTIKYTNTLAMLDALIALAETDLRLYGLGATMASGSFGLDFVEPESVAV